MTEFKIKGMRVVKGIKQKDLAKQIGVTVQYLNRIETGKVEPRRDLMIKIADLLEKSVQELFFED